LTDISYINIGIDLVDKFLAASARYRVVFGRGQDDSYVIDSASIREDAAFSANLSNDDMFELIPKGSLWASDIGWSRFLGIPFERGGRTWLFLGLEGVLPHSTRGGYPIVHGYVYLLADCALYVDGLLALARELHSTKKLWKPQSTAFLYGTYKSDADCPERHRNAEAFIIRCAVQWYQDDSPLHFRTLLLSEDEMPGLRVMFTNKIIIGHNETVDSSFSWVARKKLALLRMKH